MLHVSVSQVVSFRYTSLFAKNAIFTNFLSLLHQYLMKFAIFGKEARDVRSQKILSEL